MPKDFSIKISDFFGINRTIAEKADKNGDKYLKGEEISLFYHARQTLDKNKSVFLFENQLYDENGTACDYSDLTAKNDAIKVKNFPEHERDINFELEKPKAIAKNQAALKKVNEYMKLSNTINAYKKHEQYNNVKKVVTAQILERIKNVKSFDDIKDKKSRDELIQKTEYVTKIVIEKCVKYNIEDIAPIIADMLGNETGGYNFSDKVLSNPGKQYKGCMQVDFETICSIYGKRSNANIDIGNGRKIKAKLPDKNYDYWHKAHFSQDDERIEELKQKYKNPEDLYAAIQNDVELGLEVGIIAFKAKLHERKGSVSAAIAGYCGNQYKCKLPNVPSYFKVS